MSLIFGIINLWADLVLDFCLFGKIRYFSVFIYPGLA